MIEKLKKNLVPALLHALYTILYLIVILPFDVWVKSIVRLVKQKESGALQITKIETPWPFLSFVKTLLLEFLFDAASFLSYFIGVVLAFKAFFTMLSNEYITFGDAFKAFLGILLVTYFVPVFVSIARDIFQLLILPFRKFLSWARKPAQYFDLNHTGSLGK